jgi:hypothetical protein
MKKISQWLLMIMWVVLGSACVEPYNAPVITMERKLVVDGLITDAPGPYKVRLFMSSYLDEEMDKPIDVTNAVVTIVDDLGVEELLTEELPGEYVTSSMQGVVGRKYRLDIQLADGKIYQSSVEEINPPGEIEKLYFEFRENSINQTDLTLPQDAFWIYLDARGVSGEKNLLRWRWQGTYKTHTYPSLRTRLVANAEVPDPIPCSGYIESEGALVQVGPCECCDCWVPFYNRDVLISNNDFASDESFKRILIGKIPIDRIYFLEKFHIGVEQLAMTDAAYEFWDLLGASKHGAGNIFQPNAVQVKGNIRCVTDEDEEVFGVFSTSSVAYNEMFLSRLDVPGGLYDPDSVIIDCRQLYPGSTNQKPPFW